MKIKTSEATGGVLDWLVAKIEFGEVVRATTDKRICVGFDGRFLYTPSTNWAQGGPIVERKNIAMLPKFDIGCTEFGSDHYTQDGWVAYSAPAAYWVTPRLQLGVTPLIAAMRCYVASKLGEEVEVPDELVKA